MAKMRHRAGKSSGSPRHTEKVGPGYGGQGAGQVSAGGPGKAAMRVTPHMSAGQFQGGANSYGPPKMPTYSEE
jgi:hypothetical protein